MCWETNDRRKTRHYISMAPQQQHPNIPRFSSFQTYIDVVYNPSQQVDWVIVHQHNMSVISFAVIGKNRQPIYMKEFSSTTNTSSSSSDAIRKDDELSWLGITTAAVSSSSPTNVQLDPNSINNHSSSSSSSSRFDCSIRQQFIVHDALDFMEQWIERHHHHHHSTTPPPPPQPNAHDAMFAGLLCPIEDMKVYGTHLCFSFSFVPSVQYVVSRLVCVWIDWLLNWCCPFSRPFIPQPTTTNNIHLYRIHDHYTDHLVTRHPGQWNGRHSGRYNPKHFRHVTWVLCGIYLEPVHTAEHVHDRIATISFPSTSPCGLVQ